MKPATLKIGLLTDVHYADIPATDKRNTRASLGRVRQAVKDFREQDVDVVVCLGDLIHSGPDVETERRYLQAIVAELRNVARPIYFCLGNHCVDRLTKAEALEVIGQPAATFDAYHQGYRLIGLDSCFNPDGSSYGRRNSDWRMASLPVYELAKLDRSLSESPTPTILFCHHRIDAADDWSLRNADQVHETIQQHPHLFLVLQGHAHLHDHRVIAERDYVTLAPMVWREANQNAYSVLTLKPTQEFHLRGYFQQPSY